MNDIFYTQFDGNDERIKNYLADCLHDGKITLFLGAGVSFAFGLPGWKDLVNRILNKAKLNKLPDDCNTDQIYQGIEDAVCIIGEQAVRNEVKIALYQTVNLDELNIFQNKLLLTMLSLLLGKRRGNIRQVVTYNYDSMLEWFLVKFGLDVKCIYILPEIEGNEDVRIYHPHGFRPHPTMSEWADSDEILFRKKDAYSRIESTNLWKYKSKDLLNSSIALFIGLSPNSLKDFAIAPLINECSKIRDENIPIGFWFMSKKEMSNNIKCDFKEMAIIPILVDSFDEIILVDSFDEINDFLFEICKMSLKKLKKVCF